MESIILANTAIFVIIASVGAFIGFDLRKWSSWLLGLYGFISGSLIGFLERDTTLDYQLGVLFALVMMSAGAMNRWHRQRYKGIAEGWLEQHGQDERFSLFTRIIKRLLNK